MSDPTKILAAIDFLTRLGYTIGRTGTVAHAPAPVSATMPDPAAPFGRKLDGTPKLSAAGRPPSAPAAVAAPVAAPAFSLDSLDSLDLGDLGGIGAMSGWATRAKVAAPVAPPVKRAAPAAPPVKAAPVKAAPVAPPTSVEDEILDDLSDLFG